MATDDDTRGQIPDADAPATAAEAAQAETFGELIEGMLADEPAPPAMSAQQRSLLDIAGMIRTSANETALATGRADELIREAFDRADRPDTVPGTRVPTDELANANVVPITSRLRRSVPWAVAAVCAAAAAVLLFTRPDATPQTRAPVVATTMQSIPELHQSRPTDALVGKIARLDAAAASHRSDIIFADRMHSYRSMLYARGGNR